MRRSHTVARRLGAGILPSAVALAAVAAALVALPADASAPRHPTGPPTRRNAAFQSLYVPMRDGVRIAVDVWLPQPAAATGQVPTAMRATRYMRATTNSPEPGQDAEARRWLGAGYALVTVDARGSGASFGHRTTELSDAEVSDYGEVLDWIAGQPWSTGRIGTFGMSYDADTAELVGRLGNPHLAAVAAQWPDYDAYADLVRPGGVPTDDVDGWALANLATDGVDGAMCELADMIGAPCDALAAEIGSPRPVQGPDGPALLAAARREHQENLDLREVLPKVPFRDDRVGDFTWGGVGTRDSERLIERSRIPIFLQASWLDAGVANGALSHFLTFSNRQEVVIGPWSHGGSHDADPFRPADAPADPTLDEQWTALRTFFDRHVKAAKVAGAAGAAGAANADGGVLRYYTLGEGRWRSTTVWPPAGTQTRSWYLAAGGELSTTRPGSDSDVAGPGTDTYLVDQAATTGSQNRWSTNFGGGDVVYPDRRGADARLLTYTGVPLASDLLVRGAPTVELRLTVDRPDADLHVYLEDVAPDGTVTYVTEGVLRLSNRAVLGGCFADAAVRVPRSYARADARPMVPGVAADLTVGLVSTSVLFRRGHRVRIAIAGADTGTMVPVEPAAGGTRFVVDRQASVVRLPVTR